MAFSLGEIDFQQNEPNLKPRISIVIPVHNGESYLVDAIRSALAQELPADEIVVVDDASTDMSASVIHSEEFAGKLKYFYNEQPTGFVDAWNRAVGLASGEFVTILHQDDLLHPTYLQSIHAALVRFPEVRHLYTACNYIDENGVVTHRPNSEFNLDQPTLYSGSEYAENYINGILHNRHIHRCPGVTSQRYLLMKQCSYRKEAGHIADDDFFMRVGAYTDVIGISKPLASYRVHSESETGKLKSLSSSLARDYLFQMRENRKETILTEKSLDEIDKLAVRFINLLLCQGLTENRDDWICLAFKYREEFQSVAFAGMDKCLPRWARLLWWLVGNGESNQLARTSFAVMKALHSMKLKESVNVNQR